MIDLGQKKNVIIPSSSKITKFSDLWGLCRSQVKGTAKQKKEEGYNEIEKA